MTNETTNTIKLEVSYQLSNFIPCVREAITTLGASHYAVLRAVNAELGKLRQKGLTETKNGTLSEKKSSGLNASLTASIKLNNPEGATLSSQFAIWHERLSKADKYATIQSIVLPDVFEVWINSCEGFKATDKPVEAKKA